VANSTSKSTLESNTEENIRMKLPWNGELHSAAHKKFKETIIIVPFFEAHKTSLLKHIDFLNELGFNVISFNLKKAPRSLSGTFFSSTVEFGIKHIWADQIESILNSIAGDKIVFSFSNPSASAIEAVARRHAADVKGLICDSGPSGNFLSSMNKYYVHNEPISLAPLRWLTSLAMTLAWSPDFKTTIYQDLEKIPDNFKVLSIRGWKDNLISAQDIDKVFEPHAHIDWQRLSLPKAGHLNGLRDFAEDYKEPVASYLKSISTLIDKK